MTEANFNLGDLINIDLDLNKLALIDLSIPNNVREFTYLHIHEEAQAVARGLNKLGIARGSKIAIIADNSFEFISTYLGIMRAGSVAVLVNYKLPKEKINKILEHSEALMVFCDQNRLDLCPADIKTICFLSEDYTKFCDRGNFKSVLPIENEAAFIIYTSGTSSSDLKGVVVTHKSHIWMLKKRIPEGQIYKKWVKTESFRQILAAPMYHMSGLANVETILYGHGTIVLLGHFEPKLFAESIEKFKVVSVKAVPPMLAMILSDEALSNSVDFSSVLTIHLGGAPLSASLLAKIKNKFPSINRRIYNAYGLTEVGSGLFQRKHPNKIKAPELSVGCERPGIDYRIVDGILQIRTPAMLKEYLKSPEKLRKNITSDGFFITNDKFRVDENGFYFFEGRADDMFVSGGENIFPAEVEEVLDKHPDVMASTVLALEDEIKGTKPYAFVLYKKQKVFDEEELKNFVLQNAPAYHLPRRIWPIDKFPLTGTGKLDRKALKELALKLLDEGLKKNE